MTTPVLLLVDDSDAIIAFERAVLSPHFTCVSASNGVEALEKARKVKPAAMLLDLSMPEMDGDEVLRRLKDDPSTASIPVLVVSSETSRAAECRELGAVDFLAKPLRADELLPTVLHVLAKANAPDELKAVLAVEAGGTHLAFPLASVRRVLPQLSTRPLALGPFFARELVEVEERTLVVFDLPRRLGRAHTKPVEDRCLVVVDAGGLELAVAVDTVHDPEELAAASLQAAQEVGGGSHGLLQGALLGLARTSRGTVPVLDPQALVSRELASRLAGLTSVVAP